MFIEAPAWQSVSIQMLLQHKNFMYIIIETLLDKEFPQAFKLKKGFKMRSPIEL